GRPSVIIEILTHGLFPAFEPTPVNNVWNKKCFKLLGFVSFPHLYKLENAMKRLGNFYIVIALISFVLLATAGSADAHRRTERQSRALLRTLNAQVDDFQYGLDYQLRTSSSPVEDVENVH